MDTSPLARSRRRTPRLVAVLLAVAGAAACGVVAPARPGGDGAAAAGGDRSRAAASGKKTPDTPHLLLRLGERRLYLVDGDPSRPIASFPIAVGRTGWETPTGRFAVEEMVEHPDFVKIEPGSVPPRIIKRIPPGPTNPLGERWIGFAHGEGWTLGIHGTPNPELLGQAVSHGCVRMRNTDVVRVYEQVELGTPVVVEP